MNAQNILTNYKIEKKFKYDSIDWKIIFEITLDAFTLVLHDNSYNIFQNNFDYNYLSSLYLFENKNNIIEMVDIIINLIETNNYKIRKGIGNTIHLILISKNDNIILNLSKSDGNLREIVNILIQEIEKIKKEKDLILNELNIIKEINYKENIEINKKIIKLEEYMFKDEKKDKNYIKCVYDVKKLNEETKILNCLDLNKKKELEKYSTIPINTFHSNEEEIKNFCDLYYNNKKIDFTFNYTFLKKGENKIKIRCKNPMKNTICLFNKCESLKSLDLTRFNTTNLINMNWMFSDCSSLTSLDLSNFNTNKVISMSGIFYECSSLTSLNLSNFNTNNVIDMNYMFSSCSSLTSLDLSILILIML